MTKIMICCGNTSKKNELHPVSGLTSLVRQDALSVEGSGLFHHWQNEAGEKYFLLGHVVGLRRPDGKLSPPSLIKLETGCLENPNRIPEVEGRFVVVKVGLKGDCEIWTDQFGRLVTGLTFFL